MPATTPSVGAYIFEALRFRPQTWALLRTCETDQTVAAETPRATRFRAGSKVLVATQSAMFDGHSVRAPRAFRLDRPFDSYLHFGHGLHMCFGREINRVHLPAMAIALLEGPAAAPCAWRRRPDDLPRRLSGLAHGLARRGE